MNTLTLGVPQSELKDFETFLKKEEVNYEIYDKAKRFVPPEVITLCVVITEIALKVLAEYIKSKKETKIVIINLDGTKIAFDAKNVERIAPKENSGKKK